MPDLDLLGATADPAERLRLAVRQTYAFYESLFGQIWGTYKLQDESPVLASTLTQLGEFQAEIVDLVVAAWMPVLLRSGEARGLVIGLLNFLTYRALRHDGGLSPEQATDRMTEALLHSLEALSRQSRKEAANV
nr:J525 [uncultured bacterium]